MKKLVIMLVLSVCLMTNVSENLFAQCTDKEEYLKEVLCGNPPVKKYAKCIIYRNNKGVKCSEVCESSYIVCGGTIGGEIPPNPPTRTTPILEGKWKSGRDGRIIEFKQNGQHISANNNDGAFDHLIFGFSNNGIYQYEMTRVNLKNGCKTLLKGEISFSSSDNKQITTRIVECDGVCDLKTSFREEIKWTKVL